MELAPDKPSSQIEYGVQMTFLDPVIVLGMMSRVTSHLGLAATMSTSLHAPYGIARQFGTLDYLSEGRAGWNIVTSASDLEAQNFGMDSLPDKQYRYENADQVVEAWLALWDTWDADALEVDRASGRFADPARCTTSTTRTASSESGED